MGHSRAIEAALRWSAMTEHTPGVPLGAWLADLPDERLIRLLELRPDLAQPPPGSIAALAARAQARQSVKAATDDLDFLRLAVFDALLVLQADAAAVPFAKLVALIGERAPEAAITEALDDLRDRALAWGDTLIRVATEAAAGLPWYPGQVVLEDPTATPADIAAQIEKLDAPERELLDRLLEGSPVGRTRDAAPGTPADRPVQRLLAAGLLRQVDADTVILPRQVGQVLRGEEAGPGAVRRTAAAHRGPTSQGLRCRRRGGRRHHRPAARVRRRRRNTRRRTGSRAAQRRSRRSRHEAAGQTDRYRRDAGWA